MFRDGVEMGGLEHIPLAGHRRALLNVDVVGW
jgi:hypothetical protein